MRERKQHTKFSGNFDSCDYNSSHSPSKGMRGASGQRTSEAPQRPESGKVHKVNAKK